MLAPPLNTTRLARPTCTSARKATRVVVSRFVLPLIQGQRRKILAVYLDPSNFKNIGDGHTIADQINVVLEPYDLGAIAASNDRIGSWQLMYQMLQKGERQVADTCPKLIEAIPSHTHDEKKPGDVVVCLPHLADEDLNVRANGFVRGSQSQKGMLHNWLGGSRIM